MNDRRPRQLGELIGWFRREWAAEMPRRIHVAGVEPDSALGSPKMAPAMTARLAAIAVPGMPEKQQADAFKIAVATDHDDRLDAWSDQDAFRTPMMAALAKFGQRYPFSARFIEACAYFNWDWASVGYRRDWPAEFTEMYLETALNRLHNVWVRLDQHEVVALAN